MQYKLRPIVRSNSKIILGLTVPDDVALFFSGCVFQCEIFQDFQNGMKGILFLSGTSIIPTRQEVEKYDFSDCKI